MKKRIVSIMLILTFVLLACPISISAATTPSSTIDDWTAKVGTISALNGGVFKMDKTDTATIKQAMWNGSIYEGKVSVTFDYGSIGEAVRGPAASNPGTGANDTGIIFGGKGIKASTKTSANAIQSEDSTYFYFLYFSKSTLCLARVDNELSGDRADDWCGAVKDGDRELKYNLNGSSAPQEYKDMWAAAKTSDKIELTVAWSAAGAVRIWVNGVHIEELDGEAGTCVPYGSELGVRNGMAHDWDTKVYDFKLHGGLEIKTVVSNDRISYDPKTYTYTATSDNAMSYVANRKITSGYLVVATPTQNAIQGPVIGLSLDPDRGHTSWQGTGISYYLYDNNLNGTNVKFRVCVSDADGEYTYSAQSESNATLTKNELLLSGGQQYGDNALKSGSAVIDLTTGKITSGGSNAGKWMYHSYYSRAVDVYEEYMNKDGYHVSFDLAAKAGEDSVIVMPSSNKLMLTHKTPSFYGEYYGVRIPKSANSVSFYAVNNEKEAIGLNIDAGTLDLSTLVTGQQYSVKVKTFPEGSVINSGDSIKLSGNGISQIGKATANSDGTYTVKFMATSASASALTASVENHIFGTLTDSVGVTATGDDVATGDATFVIGVGAVLVALLGAAIIVGKKRSIA